VVSALEPIRVRTNELLEDPAELDRLLAIGAERANSQAEQTLKLVYERLGLVAAV
jgi:tryptophanyl-tRNA synthetase